jgi:hypothetical protein
MTGSSNRLSGWGAILLGEATDLVDWKSVLAERFDPWVEVHGDDTVLRSQSSSAEEVRTRALIQIQRLNGAVALALDTGVTSIRFGGVIEFGPDSQPQRTVNFAEMRASEQGHKAQMAFSVMGPDGKPIAATPRRSQVQDWMQLADNDDLLGDALIYFGRGANWSDIYKTLECLISRFGGSEEKFLALQWIPHAEVKRLKWTANSVFRHAMGKFDPPPEPMSVEHAHEFMAGLLRRALAEASQLRDSNDDRATDE